MFGKSARVKPPRNVLQGHGVLDDLSTAVGELHFSGDPFLVTSPSPDRIAGDRVCDQLDGIASISLDRTSPESVECVVDAAREVDAGHLITLDGGKPIDAAKMVSDHLDCGFISVLTAVSHDDIVSGRSSISEGDIRHSVAVGPPLAVVVDTELPAEAPWELATAGCADIISNYTAVKDWELAHRLKNVEYSEYVGTLSQMTAEILVGSTDFIKPGLEESAWIMTKTLVSSGVAMFIVDSSRSAPGAEYLFSHQFSHTAPGGAPRGHQVGVGSIMTEYFYSGTRGEQTDIRDAPSTMGAPTTVDELGIDDEMIIEALTTAHEIRDRYTTLGDDISEEAVIEVVTITGVI